MRPTFMRLKRPADPFQDQINAAMRPKLARLFAEAISARAQAINAEREIARLGNASGVSDADVRRILEGR